MWRHRRTERYDIVSAEEIRRHVTVDLTVPRELWADLRVVPPCDRWRRSREKGRDGQFVVPLGWLERGPLVGFDLRQDGASIPLLLASEIELVTRSLLKLELEVTLVRRPELRAGDFQVRAETLIEEVVRYDVPDDAVERVAAFERAYGTHITGLADLMRTSVNGWLLLALLPRVDRRQLVKHASDVPFPHQPRGGLWLETPGVFEASSTHLEGPLPAELRARSWVLAADRGSTTIVEGDSNTDHPSLYVTSERALSKLGPGARPTTVDVGVSARLAVERWRFHVPAVVLSCAGTAVLMYGAYGADLVGMTKDGRQGSVVTILIASVALFVALLLRLEEHSVARRLLAVSRVLLTAVLIVLLIAAAALAFGGRSVDEWWLWLARSAVVLTVALVVSAWRAAPTSRGVLPRPAPYWRTP